MAAFNDIVSVPAAQWTLAGNGAAASGEITIQPHGAQAITINGTVGTGAAPSSPGVGVRITPGETGIRLTLADLFPGVTGVNTAWIWCDVATTVFVSHKA
jgi:hypothetical protein